MRRLPNVMRKAIAHGLEPAEPSFWTPVQRAC